MNVRQLLMAASASIVMSTPMAAQDATVPDDRIHIERVSGGQALIRDVRGSYAQHPKMFAELMALREKLFAAVGACFGIYPDDPDAVENASDLHWQIGVRVAPAARGQKLAIPPRPYRLASLADVEAAVIETNVKTAGIDGLAMFRWMAEHGYVQTAPTRIEYLSHDGDAMLLPVKIVVPVRKRPSGLTLPAR